MRNLLARSAQDDPFLTGTANVLHDAFQVLRQLNELNVLLGFSFLQIVDLVITTQCNLLLPGQFLRLLSVRMGCVLNLAPKPLQSALELVLVAVTVVYPRFELLSATRLPKHSYETMK